MGDVADGVVDLARAQRAQRPVGEARRLVDACLDQLGDQGLVAHRIAEAANHGGDLGVEKRRRQAIHQDGEDLHVLARRMEDLEDFGIGQQVEQGREVDAVGQGVDGARLVRPRHLDQAEARPIGALAHELGIDGDELGVGQAAAEGGQRRRVGDHSLGHGGELYTETRPLERGGGAKSPYVWAAKLSFAPYMCWSGFS